MKKYFLLFMIGALVALTSCGSGSTTTETTDSTSVTTCDTTTCDSTHVEAMDSTKAVK